MFLVMQLIIRILIQVYWHFVSCTKCNSYVGYFRTLCSFQGGELTQAPWPVEQGWVFSDGGCRRTLKTKLLWYGQQYYATSSQSRHEVRDMFNSQYRLCLDLCKVLPLRSCKTPVRTIAPTFSFFLCGSVNYFYHS